MKEEYVRCMRRSEAEGDVKTTGQTAECGVRREWGKIGSAWEEVVSSNGQGVSACVRC